MPNKLYVGNLPFTLNSVTLTELFESCGDIENAFVVLDKETHRSKGFGFVEMCTVEGMDSALKLINGRQVNGRILKVNVAVERKDRTPQPIELGTGTCGTCHDESVTLHGFEDNSLFGIWANCIRALFGILKSRK